MTQGQYLDHFGAGEPHLPVLEALGRLCRGPEGARVIEALHRRVLGATRKRMLRELGEAVEMLASDRLLVLVLEDVHWSDAATLDVLAGLV